MVATPWMRLCGQPVVWLVAGVLLIAGCSANDDELARLQITGSSTVAPLLSEIAARCEVERALTRADVGGLRG